MEEQNMVGPNRQARLRAASKQKEARAKITKPQLWKAIDELRAALANAVEENRRFRLESERDRTVLAALLARNDNSVTITIEELDDLVGMCRMTYAPSEDPEGYVVELIQVDLDDDLPLGEDEEE